MNGGKFIMNGGSISNNSAMYYGAVLIGDGKFILNDGIISDSNSVMGGGGVFVGGSGEFIMNGGTISDNTNSGVFVVGEFTMHGGIIRNNSSSNGGGVRLGIGGIFRMFGGSISGNVATHGGGVLVDINGEFTMNGGSIIDNIAEWSHNVGGGGGVHVNSGEFIMHDGIISDNIASWTGGGVDVIFGNFTMNGGLISGNASSMSGGGVFVSTTPWMPGKFVMNNGTIKANTASDNGGGLTGGDITTIKGGIISGNATQQNGGGIFLCCCNEFTMVGGEIRNNRARYGGGIYIFDFSYSSLNIYPAAIFSGNSANGPPRIFTGTPDVSAYIRTTSTSVPGLHPLNNWDINFSGGLPAISFTVTFLDWDGTTINEQQVLNGNAATAPPDPTRVGHTFTCWDRAFDNITENITVTAQYAPTPAICPECNHPEADCICCSDCDRFPCVCCPGCDNNPCVPCNDCNECPCICDLPESGIDYEGLRNNEIRIIGRTFSFADSAGLTPGPTRSVPPAPRSTPNENAVINLTRETLTLNGFTIYAYCIIGGNTAPNRRWRDGSNLTPERFVRYLNNGFELWICFRNFNTGSGHPQGSGNEHNIIAFSQIHGRAARPNVAINYEIGADMSGRTGGDFLLTSRNVPRVIKYGIEIGRADARGRAVDENHFGIFFEGATNGVPVPGLTPEGRATRERFFIRTAPRTNSDGTFTAASVPRRITVLGNGRPTTHRINYSAETVRLARGQAILGGRATEFTVSAVRTNHDISPYITRNDEIRIKRAATARRPATAIQRINPQTRAPLAETLPLELPILPNGRIDPQALRSYSVLVTAANGTQRWRAVPRFNANNVGELEIRANPTARRSGTVWSGYAASLTGTLTTTWGVVGRDSRNRDIMGVTSAVITPAATTPAMFGITPPTFETTTPAALQMNTETERE